MSQAGQIALTDAAGAELPERPPKMQSGRLFTVLKFALPALVAALLLVIVLWPQVAAQHVPFRIQIIDKIVSGEQNDRTTMLNARYDGQDGKGQPYSLTADQAIQMAAVEDLIELELPKGDIALDDGTWVALNAEEGLYNRFASLLDLEGGVSLFHDRGFEIVTQSAQIDLEAGTARGYRPVKGHGPEGTIDSEGFRLMDWGDVIVFTGNSRLILNTGKPDAGE